MSSILYTKKLYFDVLFFTNINIHTYHKNMIIFEGYEKLSPLVLYF